MLATKPLVVMLLATGVLLRVVLLATGVLLRVMLLTTRVLLRGVLLVCQACCCESCCCASCSQGSQGSPMPPLLLAMWPAYVLSAIGPRAARFWCAGGPAAGPE